MVEMDPIRLSFPEGYLPIFQYVVLNLHLLCNCLKGDKRSYSRQAAAAIITNAMSINKMSVYSALLRTSTIRFGIVAIIPVLRF